mgnify:CR=1 FL=1
MEAVVTMSDYSDFLALLGFGGAHPGGIELTKKLIDDHRINKPEKILEVGCGTGQTSAFLTMSGFDITPIDCHPLMVEKANKRFRELNLKCHALQKDIHESIFQPNSFDVILAESVLTFTNLKKSIPQLSKLLKKNGKIIAIEMTKTENLSKELENDLKNFYHLPQILSEAEWNKIMKDNRLETEVKGLDLNSLPSSEQELDPSDNIEKKYFDILIKHEELVMKSLNTLKASIIVAKKV